MARCLIVEDEPLARRKLRAALEEAGLFASIEEAASLQEARARYCDVPEALFLDIRLPDGSGLDLLRDQPLPAVLVFTTAFDEHAVTAFELQALDYLVKPFSHERIARTLDRVRRALRAPAPDLAGRVADALAPRAPRIITVRVGDGLKPLRVAEVESIEGVDDHAGLWVDGRRFLLYRRLADLERVLGEAGFVRIHRSHLVNVAHVAQVTPKPDGRAALTLRSGRRLPCSRRGAPRLRDALHFGA